MIPVIILVHIGFGSIDSRIIMNPKKKAKSCTQSNIGVITKVIMLKTIGFFKVFIFLYLLLKISTTTTDFSDIF